MTRDDMHRPGTARRLNGSGTGTANVEVSGLRVELAQSGNDIIDDVSLTIAPGEIVGLVGESGSGKTTLGLAMLGHARRGAKIVVGTVHVDGAELVGRNERDLRGLRGYKVSYVPQDPRSAINPSLRIGRQLMETLAAHDFGGSADARRERISEMLGEVRLPRDEKFLRRYPHQLSGGQLQRVALAMAFACRPRLIVFDEPTTGLDVTTQAHILKTIGQLCLEHAVAALYVTHDLAVVASLASRVGVMYAGRLVEIGPASEVFAAAAHPYTRRLIGAAPGAGVELHGIPGRAPRPGVRPGGCFFAPRCSYVRDECHSGLPPLVRVAHDHDVRCVRHSEVRAAARDHEPEVGRAIGEADDAVVLRATSISASYGQTEVLHDIDLTLRARECLALVGESGSGKSTLAHCIVGLHRQFTGEINYFGRSLAADCRTRDRDTRRQLQYIFQNPYGSLNPRRTVGQNVSQPLRLFYRMSRRELQQRVMHALDRVALGASAARQYPDQLSGGERQRVAIARALACEPTVLICDEITSALDVSVQAAIIELLEELQRDLGLALLFVTHNLPLVSTIAHRVAVMNGGKIVEAGNTSTVFEEPADGYTRQLLADSPTIDRVRR